MKNLSKAWIDGSTNHKTSNVIDYAKSVQVASIQVVSVMWQNSIPVKLVTVQLSIQNQTQTLSYCNYIVIIVIN